MVLINFSLIVKTRKSNSPSYGFLFLSVVIGSFLIVVVEIVERIFVTWAGPGSSSTSLTFLPSVSLTFLHFSLLKDSSDSFQMYQKPCLFSHGKGLKEPPESLVAFLLNPLLIPPALLTSKMHWRPGTSVLPSASHRSLGMTLLCRAGELTHVQWPHRSLCHPSQ